MKNCQKTYCWSLIKTTPKLAQGTVIRTKFELSFFNKFTLPKRELQVTEYTEVHLV
jgi:hypothetical protein